ncbi:CAP family protein [Flavobacteriaceae bacterium]|nr:CAP family protein [Flavobacteriaceae bacterium]MDB4714581.1 CAP family protein [Flavobacteriaceae bacterium]MDB4773403.1 CAP family protein [Flavobacteriaceae bacterium]
MKKILLLTLPFFLFVAASKDLGTENIGLISSQILTEEDRILSLKVHNDARKEVGVSELSWSNALAADALVWAKNLALKDKMYHSSNESRPEQGENLAYSYSSTNGVPTFSKTPGKEASIRWYNEIKDYTYAEIGSSKNADVVIGHYTQMVWSTTKTVGMAQARSATGNVYVVARYGPPGNWVGKHPY